MGTTGHDHTGVPRGGETGGVDVDGAADELYRLAPEDFTARRDQLAGAMRAGGDRAGAASVRALRRPTTSAWLVNQLVHDDAPGLAALHDLAEALRAAQGALDAPELRQLAPRRHEVIAGLVERARQVAQAAGREVGGPVLEEVRRTLEAAVADVAADAAVRSGRLVAPLSYSGLGEVDLTGATAATARSAPPTSEPADAIRRRRQRSGEAGSAASAPGVRGDDAEAVLVTARRALEGAQAEDAQASEAADAAVARADELAQALDEAKRVAKEAKVAADRAAAARIAAEDRVTAAQRVRRQAEPEDRT